MKKRLLIVFTIMLSFFGIIACGKQPSSTPDNEIVLENIQFNNTSSLITWNGGKCEDGYDYIININNEIEDTTGDSCSFFVRDKYFKDNKLIYQVRVEKDNVSIAESQSYSFYRYPKINDIKIEQNKITWDVVANAAGYLVRIGNKNYTPTTNVLEIPSIEVGKHIVEVKATWQHDNYFAEFGDKIEVTKLSAVSGISFSNRKLSIIAPDDQLIDTTIYVNNQVIHNEKIYSNQTINVEPSIYTYKIEAFIQSTNDHVISSDKKEYYVFPKISNVTYNNGVISWQRVLHATGYIVSIDGIEQEVTENSIDNLNVTVENDIDIQVRPIIRNQSVEWFYSEYSDIYNIRKLDVPVLTFNDGKAFVSSSGTDEVRVTYQFNNEAEVTFTTTPNRVLDIDFSRVGTYKVYAQAIGDKALVIDSEISTLFVFPKISNISYNNGKLTWESVAGATGYTLKVNGLDFTSSKNEYIVPDLNMGDVHSISIRATLGNHNNTSYYSIFSDTFTISRAYTPIIKYIGAKLFVSTPKDCGLQVSISRNGVQESTFIMLSNSNIDYDFLTSEMYEVNVQVINDGSNVVISDIATFYMLPRISSVSFNNGVFTWEPVLNASGYQVQINGVIQHTSNNYFSQSVNLGEIYSFKVKAIFDNSNYHSEYSDEYIVERYQTPTIRYTSGVVHIESNKIIPVRVNIILNGKEFRNFTIESNSSFTIDDINAGTYVITVQAIGNGSNIIDSELNSITIYPRINDISYANGKVSWQSIYGAVNYFVTINGQDVIVDTNSIELPQFNDGDRYSVYVKAYSYTEVHYTQISREFTAERLALPKLNYSGEYLYIDTSKVVMVRLNITRENGNVETITVSTDTPYKLNIDRNVTYTISAQVISFDGNYYESGVSTIYIFPTVTNFDYNNTKVSWGYIKYATKFEVVINSRVEYVTTNEYIIPDFDFNEIYTIYVRAIFEGDEATSYYSEYSDKYVVERLIKPTLTYVNGKVLVQSNTVLPIVVEVRFNGIFVKTENVYNNTYLNYSVSSTGTYSFFAQTKGNGSNIIESEIVTLYLFPNMNNIRYSNNTFSWDEVYGADYYIAEMNGQLIDIYDTEFVVPELKTGEVITFAVRSIIDEYNTTFFSMFGTPLKVERLTNPAIYYMNGKIYIQHEKDVYVDVEVMYENENYQKFRVKSNTYLDYDLTRGGTYRVNAITDVRNDILLDSEITTMSFWKNNDSVPWKELGTISHLVRHPKHGEINSTFGFYYYKFNNKIYYTVKSKYDVYPGRSLAGYENWDASGFIASWSILNAGYCTSYDVCRFVDYGPSFGPSGNTQNVSLNIPGLHNVNTSLVTHYNFGIVDWLLKGYYKYSEQSGSSIVDNAIVDWSINNKTQEAKSHFYLMGGFMIEDIRARGSIDLTFEYKFKTQHFIYAEDTRTSKFKFSLNVESNSVSYVFLY